MEKKKARFENLKIAASLMDLLRKHKEKTGVPAATFVSRLVREKLGKLNTSK
jgi:hypothetical protein